MIYTFKLLTEPGFFNCIENHNLELCIKKIKEFFDFIVEKNGFTIKLFNEKPNVPPKYWVKIRIDLFNLQTLYVSKYDYEYPLPFTVRTGQFIREMIYDNENSPIYAVVTPL